MLKKRFLSFWIFIFVLSSNLMAQETQLDLNQKLKLDQTVKTGKFSNGLTYFIKKNVKPEKRAELRLVVNAGAMQEEDNQNGLAHFCEHMAFNGTKKYEKQEIIDFLESIGMKFGPEINAYTNQEETVYMLHLPTDSLEILEKGFDILNEWAFNVSYEADEIDKERGVVIEEWRLGRGAGQRLRNKHNKVILKDSKYATHDVIGKKEIIENADYETIKKFYKDWYRPDLMAVIAVGDFDENQVLTHIKNHFDKPYSNSNIRKRVQEKVNKTVGTEYSIESDKEATQSSFRILYKGEATYIRSLNDYRTSLVNSLYFSMFNQRLSELTMQAEPPFINAYFSGFNWTRTCKAYSFFSLVKDNGIENAMTTILEEAKKVQEFGFNESEFKRAKTNFKSGYEKYYNERDKRKSVNLANELVYGFLNNNPVQSVEDTYKLFVELIDNIKLPEVNKLSNISITKENRVVVVSLPEKESIKKPTKENLAAIFNKVEKSTVERYTDNVNESDLITYNLSSGKIISTKYFEETEVSEFKLSNGVRIVVKPTDFKNDEIIFRSFSIGGNTLAPKEKFHSAQTASSIVSMGGVGEFSMIELQKKLTGKVLRVNPWIGSMVEGISGSATPKDFEDMLKLVNLYFNSPRKDSTAFLSLKSRFASMLKNQEANPQKAFQDTLRLTLSQNHYSAKSWDENDIGKIDLNDAYNFYKDRFADASDFTFIFVGNIDIEKSKPLFEKYLGSLPSINRKEHWKDLGVRMPTGVIKKDVYKGIDQKSQVSINFTGLAKHSKEEAFYFNSLADYLNIRLRELIREDKSGTYGVGVRGSFQKIPYENYMLSINFGCSPERTDELINEIFTELKRLQKEEPADSYIVKIIESKLKSYEKNLKENGYWAGKLYNIYWNNKNQNSIFEYPDMVETLRPEKIKEMANKYINFENYVQVVSYPEKNK